MSDDTRDPRPAPQYGEYATPEEQRARIRLPDATGRLETGHAPVQPAPQPWGPPAPQAAPPAQPWAPPRSGAQASAAGARPGDRLATMILLGVGLVYVLLSSVSLFDLPDALTQAMHTLGVPGEFTNVDSARLWGIVAAVVLLVGYAGTAAIALRRLRRGRLSWWIPLVGAVVTFAVVYGLMTIPILGDPAFLDYVSQMTRS